MTLIGGAIGLAAALWLGQAAESLLFELQAGIPRSSPRLPWH